MADYKYVARNASGEPLTGSISATTAEEVAAELFKQGLVPITIEPAKKAKISIFKMELTGGKVKTEELIYFCRQLYVLIKAGVPITSAMQRIDATVRSELLKSTLRAVSSDISAGMNLSDAFAKHPKIFSIIFINMVRTGEKSGKLEEAFDQTSKYLGLEEKTRKRVVATLRYPLTVIGMLVISFLIVNVVIMPVFEDLFAQLKGQLPWQTRSLIAISNFMIHHYLILLAISITIVYLFIRFIRTPNGALVWSRTKLRIYIFGPILKKVLLGRFARVFAMTLHAGVPITQGLTLVANTMGYPHMTQNLNKMSQGIEEGRSLTEMAIRSELFSPLVIQMLSIGEESGTIDVLLDEVAEYYEREVDYDLDRLGDLMEPILLSIIASFVLFFAMVY